jgi:hypothetical protein
METVGALQVSVTSRDEQGRVATELRGAIDRRDLHPLAHVLGGELRTLGAWERMPQESYEEMVTRVRRTHGNAYTPWRADEERDLLVRFRAGASLPELSQALGRSPTALYGRLVQLGEIDA